MSKKISGLKTEPMSSVFGSNSGSVLSITIPDCPPSLNKVLRMHWANKRKLNTRWQALVWALIPHKGNRWEQKRKRVVLTLHHSRFYDKDNAYGACKVVVDAMRHCGFIVNDTAEWLDLSVEQEKCSHKTRHTVIEIGAA